MKINIIVPTLNEFNNISIITNSLINILNQSQYKNTYKICIVDDNSKDGTNELLLNLKEKHSNIFDYIIRKNEKGLSSAIIYGFDKFPADYYIVTDADIQYDLSIIPEMIRMALEEEKEIVIANRMLKNDNFKWKKSLKYKISRVGFNITKFLIKKDLPEDILTGFFMVNNNFYNRVKSKLSLVGFKILLDFFLSSSIKVNYGEVYSYFKSREIGESKMDFSILCDFIYMIFINILKFNKKLVRYIVYLMINMPSFIFLFISYVSILNLNINPNTSIFIAFLLKFIFNLNFTRLIEWSYNRSNYFNYLKKLNYQHFIGLIVTGTLIYYFNFLSLDLGIVFLLFLLNITINYYLLGDKWKFI